MMKQVEVKVIVPTSKEIRATKEYKALMAKIKSMTKTIIESDEPI